MNTPCTKHANPVPRTDVPGGCRECLYNAQKRYYVRKRDAYRLVKQLMAAS